MRIAAYKLWLALLLLPMSAQAQQARPSDAKLNAIIQAVAQQRNAANDQIANLVGELADRDEKIAVLEKRLKEAKACRPEGVEK